MKKFFVFLFILLPILAYSGIKSVHARKCQAENRKLFCFDGTYIVDDVMQQLHDAGLSTLVLMDATLIKGIKSTLRTSNLECQSGANVQSQLDVSNRILTWHGSSSFSGNIKAGKIYFRNEAGGKVVVHGNINAEVFETSNANITGNITAELFKALNTNITGNITATEICLDKGIVVNGDVILKPQGYYCPYGKPKINGKHPAKSPGDVCDLICK